MNKSALLAMLAMLVLSSTIFANIEASHEWELFPRRCPYELYGTTTNGSNGPSDLLALDPTNGDGITIATISGSGAHRVTGLEFSEEGILYAVGEDENDVSSLMIINCYTAWAFIVGPTGIGSNQSITDISFDSNGVLWAYLETGSGNPTDQVGTIDLDTGAFTLVGDTGINDSGNGLSFTLSDELYHAGKVNLSLIDQITGAGTTVAPLDFDPPADTNPRIHAMDVRPANGIMFGSLNDKASGSGATPENYLVTINLITGYVSFLAMPPERAPDNLSGISFNPRYRGCLP